MMILLHIISALAGIIYSLYLVVKPTKPKFYIAYGLVALALASGAYLVFSLRLPMTQACTTGLVYLALIMSELIFARRRLVNLSDE